MRAYIRRGNGRSGKDYGKHGRGECTTRRLTGIPYSGFIREKRVQRLQSHHLSSTSSRIKPRRSSGLGAGRRSGSGRPFAWSAGHDSDAAQSGYVHHDHDKWRRDAVPSDARSTRPGVTRVRLGGGLEVRRRGGTRARAGGPPSQRPSPSPAAPLVILVRLGFQRVRVRARTAGTAFPVCLGRLSDS